MPSRRDFSPARRAATLPAVRSPLPRTILIRLETGRLVLYSLLAGGLVGLIGSGVQLILNRALDLGAAALHYRPPGTAGEGGLLIEFGEVAPYALLLLPVLAAIYVSLTPSGRRSEPLNAVVAGYHARGEWNGARGHQWDGGPGKGRLTSQATRASPVPRCRTRRQWRVR